MCRYGIAFKKKFHNNYCFYFQKILTQCRIWWILTMVEQIFALTIIIFAWILGNSVLHIAAQNGRTGIVKDLILGGADVNKGNNHKNTALHLGKNTSQKYRTTSYQASKEVQAQSYTSDSIFSIAMFCSSKNWPKKLALLFFCSVSHHLIT